MIVTKAVKMAQMMDIPVLGLVENYSYFQLPRLRQGARHLRREQHRGRWPGRSGHPGAGQAAHRPGGGRRPCDEGRIESYEPNPLAGVAQELDEKLGEA